MNSIVSRLLLIVLVALLPALGVELAEQMRTRHLREQLMENDVRRLVGLVSAEQQRIIEGAAQVLDLLASSPAVRDNDANACQILLANLVAQTSGSRAFSVIGRDGHVRCGQAGLDRSADRSGRDYFRRAMASGSIALGDYSAGPTSGIPGIFLAKPFIDATGVIDGVVVLKIRLDWLAGQLALLHLPGSATALVADRHGTILARWPEPLGRVGKSIQDGRESLLARKDVRIEYRTGFDGRRRVIAYAPPGDSPTGLLVTIGLDRDIAYAEITQANRRDLLLMVSAAVLAVLLAALLGARLIRRPVNRLLATAERWRAGDLAARTGLASHGGEFGRLATAFDAMAGALQNRERALITALESTTDHVLVLDHTWRFTFRNRHAREQDGARSRIGQVIWDEFPELHGSVFENAYRTAMRSGQPTRAEGVFAHSGTYFEAHAYPSAEGLTVFLRDVTEERRMAAALGESEALFRAIFEQAALGIGLVDADGRILQVNEKLCAITGYERAELLALSFAELTHPEDRAADVAQRSAVFSRTDGSYHLTKRYVRKDGTEVWVNLVVSALVSGRVTADGTPDRYIGIVEDITARRSIEAALEETQTRLELARKAAGFGVWDRNLVTGAAIWSEEQWRLHGLVPAVEPPSLDSWFDTIHPEDRDRVRAERAAILAERPDGFDHEYRVLLPDGTVRWLQSKAKIVRDATGTAVRSVGLSLDVTASRETQRALRLLSDDLAGRVRAEVAAREAAQMRAAQAERMQALGLLAGGIAHDFNNVLQAVMGAASLINRRADDEAGVRRLARMALDAVDRGASITRRLLAFARRDDLRAESLDVAGVLRDMEEILSHTLGAGISVRLRLGTALPPMLADKGQLETVLVNLATNARDAMPLGGALTLGADVEPVAAGAPHPAGLAPGTYVRLTIVDTGCGMGEATLARVGEPFFTTKRSGAGTGLGLSMARGFAEQSGGALAIASQPGLGTIVTIWLPRADPVCSPPGPGMVRRAVGGPMQQSRILVVDDEPAVRETLAAHLRNAGFEVVEAADGAAGLELLAGDPPVDALVTDLSMPGMDGLALIRAAQRQQPGLPALLLTGYVGDGAALAVSGAVTGAFSLLRKPVSDVQLLDRLHAMLETREKVG